MAKNPNTWKKGQSGNPKGRPRKSEAIAVLVRAAGDRKITAKDRKGRKGTAFELALETAWNAAVAGDLQALRLLLEYGWGKPVQAVEVDSDTRVVIEYESPVEVPKPATLAATRSLVTDAISRGAGDNGSNGSTGGEDVPRAPDRR
jgi:hypothetical protein